MAAVATAGGGRQIDCITADNRDEEDESRDAAAPLPDFHAGDVHEDGAADDDKCVKRAPASDVGGTRRFAKGKRKLRETRRSTGVATYNCTSDRQPSPVDDVFDDDDDDDDEAADETNRNTSYNETFDTSLTSISCSTPADFHGAASTTTSGMVVVPDTSRHPTSNDTTVTTTDRSTVAPGTSPAPQTSLPSVACMPTNRSRDAVHADSGRKKTAPTVPPKPTVRARPTGTACSARQPRPPNKLASTTVETDERTTMLTRVHALEKQIHDASVEHLLLKETLQVRENRIAELETEVEALNKDLDLADEDYDKLEEENRALMRVIAQLSPC